MDHIAILTFDSETNFLEIAVSAPNVLRYAQKTSIYLSNGQVVAIRIDHASVNESELEAIQGEVSSHLERTVARDAACETHVETFWAAEILSQKSPD